jgi:hypothetical protein
MKMCGGGNDAGLRCLIGQDFSRSVASKQGFEFVGESKDPRQPQGAVVATQVGWVGAVAEAFCAGCYSVGSIRPASLGLGI